MWLLTVKPSFFAGWPTCCQSTLDTELWNWFICWRKTQFYMSSVNRFLPFQSEYLLKIKELNKHIWRVNNSLLLVGFRHNTALLRVLNHTRLSPMSSHKKPVFLFCCHSNKCATVHSCVRARVCVSVDASLVFRLNPIIPACLSTRISTLTHITHVHGWARQLGMCASVYKEAADI